MKKLIIMVLVLGICLNFSYSSVKAESIEKYNSVEFTVANSRLRASKIVLNTGWSFNSNRCAFSIDFLQNSTGSGTVTLQKKVNNSWADHRSLIIGFKNVYSMSDSITVSNLSSGEYRLKFYITANGVTETQYTWSETL